MTPRSTKACPGKPSPRQNRHIPWTSSGPHLSGIHQITALLTLRLPFATDFGNAASSTWGTGAQAGEPAAGRSRAIQSAKRTKFSRDRTRLKAAGCMWPCVVSPNNRTKVFHVKRFCPIGAPDRTFRRTKPLKRLGDGLNGERLCFEADAVALRCDRQNHVRGPGDKPRVIGLNVLWAVGRMIRRCREEIG